MESAGAGQIVAFDERSWCLIPHGGDIVRLNSRLILLVVLTAVFTSGVAIGQLPSGAKATVVGTGAFTAFVENMDRSLAFYHDAFGMEVPALPVTGERPYNPANPQLFDMFDIAGAKERHQSARITGTRVTLELMEIQNVPHQTINLRMQDPGNAALVLMVRDVDAALARDAGQSDGRNSWRQASCIRRRNPVHIDSRH
jgi:catechol 2,3-dioxygenase-like lactoylglutathione lyase family enzyme